MIKNEDKQMKYGEILDFRTKDKAVVGNKYAFTDILFNLEDSPEKCTIGVLVRVNENNKYPFTPEGYSYSYQFAREIIEEKPKYRPYKDTNELKADFFKDYPEMGKRYRPAIWIVSSSGAELEISFFSKEGSYVLTNNACGHTMEDLFKNFTYLDGSPCGIKE